MKYQKIINLLDSTPNEPSKFRTKHCAKINDDSCGTYSCKTSTLKSSLCDYSDAYVLVKRTITVPNTAAANDGDKKVILKTCAPFTDCI